MSSSSPGRKLIHTGALLRAAGIGVGVGLVLEILSAGAGLAAVSFATGAGSSDVGATTLINGVVWVFLCCFTLLMFGGIGAGYGWFAGKSGSPLKTGPVALGGAIAAYVDGILMGICSVGVNAITNNLATQSGNPAFGAALRMFGLAGTGYGLIVGACIIPFIYAVMGAAGGAIYAAVVSNRSKPRPAAM